jgi:hypothetical protein
VGEGPLVRVPVLLVTGSYRPRPDEDEDHEWAVRGEYALCDGTNREGESGDARLGINKLTSRERGT